MFGGKGEGLPPPASPVGVHRGHLVHQDREDQVVVDEVVPPNLVAELETGPHDRPLLLSGIQQQQQHVRDQGGGGARKPGDGSYSSRGAGRRSKHLLQVLRGRREVVENHPRAVAVLDLLGQVL